MNNVRHQTCQRELRALNQGQETKALVLAFSWLLCALCQIFSSLFDSVSSLLKGTLLFQNDGLTKRFRWIYTGYKAGPFRALTDFKNICWAPGRCQALHGWNKSAYISKKQLFSRFTSFLVGEIDNTQVNNEQDHFRWWSWVLKKKTK